MRMYDQLEMIVQRCAGEVKVKYIPYMYVLEGQSRGRGGALRHMLRSLDRLYSA